jgi:hypothetical protein
VALRQLELNTIVFTDVYMGKLLINCAFFKVYSTNPCFCSQDPVVTVVSSFRAAPIQVNYCFEPQLYL